MWSQRLSYWRQCFQSLRDSKRLTERRREQLAEEIKATALCWSLGRASVEEIDSINILQASLLAMSRAVEGLTIQPDHILVDGNRLPTWSYSAEAIVGGDGSEPAISAASIIAKVTRDNELIELDKQYPGYGLAGHKGYPTKAHIEAIAEKGVLSIHRKSLACRPFA